MPNVFAKAKENAATVQPKSAKKGSEVIQTEGDISEAIDAFHAAHVILKNAEADKKTASSTILPHCKLKWVDEYATHGKKPSESLKFMSENGNKVTLIIQDRGGNYSFTDEQLVMVESTIGEKAKDLIEDTTTFSFDNSILDKPGVMDELSKAIDNMVKKKIITEADASQIIQCTQKRTMKKGALDDLNAVCDGDQTKMLAILQILSNHMSAYINPSM